MPSVSISDILLVSRLFRSKNVMPRFVLLRHTDVADGDRSDHFDLMLEHGDRLLTWAIDSLPGEGDAISALKLPDHRLAYLDYEGEISQGRGNVERIDSGSYAMVQLTEGLCVVDLGGEVLRGRVQLKQLESCGWRISTVVPETD